MEYVKLFEPITINGLEISNRTVMPVGIRIAGNDFMDGGHTNRESAMFAAAAEATGVNAINVMGG